jgi:LuxR family transcriptional regulator, maltose regulon positive regulatory protein
MVTVRTDTRNIYAKLGVSNRRAAARRADEIGVLSRTCNHGAGRVVSQNE